MTADPMTAVLDQLAAHADRITRLGARHDADRAAATAQLTRLAALARSLDAQITAITARLDGIAPAGRDEPLVHVPAPAPRWWKLTGPERDEAVSRLRGWVEQVYRPGYGQLAATLGPCWDQHPLCLYALDILAELWSVLHLAAVRTPAMLTGQAEYQARILPALAEQMAAETTRCPHTTSRLPGRGYPRSAP
jgi:hypothetical protein